MARRRPTGRFPALRQGQRRESLWLQSEWANVALGTNSAAIIGTLNAAALALRPFTVVRSRGYLHIITDQVVASEQIAVVLGHIVVSDEAVAIGVTAVPTPETEAGSDWHVFEPLASSFTFISAVGTDDPAGAGIAWDSKAMRKVDLGEQLIEVVEAGVTGVSEGVIIRVFTRVLIKLH